MGMMIPWECSLVTFRISQVPEPDNPSPAFFAHLWEYKATLLENMGLP